MKEADLKRALVRSIRAQDGLGQRIEDKYAVGWPDLVMSPPSGGVFFTEAKIIRGSAKLVCTPIQEVQLNRCHRPKGRHGYYSHGVIVAYHPLREVLYIGRPNQSLMSCRYVKRPNVLDSTEWLISDLLEKYEYERIRQGEEEPVKIDEPE